MNKSPNYTRLEFERRFLIRTEDVGLFSDKPFYRTIEDKYWKQGRLRLRSMTDSDTGKKNYKLCKKFVSETPYFQPIVNIYLSEDEYRSLRDVPAFPLMKYRYYDEIDGQVFSIDVFKHRLNGLVMVEAEASSLETLQKLAFPSYAFSEVTEDEFFTGGNLCRISPTDLKQKLSDKFH